MSGKKALTAPRGGRHPPHHHARAVTILLNTQKLDFFADNHARHDRCFSFANASTRTITTTAM